MATNRARRALLAGLSCGVLASAACTSSSSHADPSPLPTGSSQPPFYCGFLSKQSVQVAVGTKKMTASGAPVYYVGQQRNEDGGRFGQASCTIDDASGVVVDVQIEPFADRPDIAQQVVNDAATRHDAGYRFPASYGVGLGLLDNGGHVELLRGSWLVAVALPRPAKGRDALQDAVAITRQVVAFFRLPTTHAKPYPTATKS